MLSMANTSARPCTPIPMGRWRMLLRCASVTPARPQRGNENFNHSSDGNALTELDRFIRRAELWYREVAHGKKRSEPRRNERRQWDLQNVTRLRCFKVVANCSTGRPATPPPHTRRLPVRGGAGGGAGRPGR